MSAADLAAELETKRSKAYFAEALREQTILVAIEDDALAGYVELGDVGIAGVDARPDDRELHRLYVDAPWQGRGVGRALTEAALAHPRLRAASRIYLQVWEENTRAVRLYESLGFRAVGTTQFTIGDEQAEDLVMRLDR